jgi:hypothetical protein
VQLERAARLSVRLEGLDPEGSERVRMQLSCHPAGVPALLDSEAMLSPGAQVVRWDGLLPGRARVQLSGSMGSPCGDVPPASGMLTAGEETELTLRRDPVLTRPVQISGELHVPAAYALEELGLLLINARDPAGDWVIGAALSEDLTLTELSPGRFAFEGRAPCPGQYQLLVPGCDYVTPDVVVPPGGLQGLAVRVPEPAEFEVVCRLADGGEPSEVPDLFASRRDDRLRASSARPLRLRFDPSTGAFSGRCPSGYLELHAGLGQLVGERLLVELAAGRNRFEYKVYPPLEVHVDLAFEGPVPRLAQSLWGRPRVERLDGPDAVYSLVDQGERWVLEVCAAGRFRLTPALLPGYRRPPPVEIEVTHGAVSRAQITYQRLQPPP